MTKVRSVKDFKVSDLAKHSGVSSTEIRQAENGGEISKKNVSEIAKILDVSFDWIYNGAGCIGDRYSKLNDQFILHALICELTKKEKQNLVSVITSMPSFSYCLSGEVPDA